MSVHGVTNIALKYVALMLEKVRNLTPRKGLEQVLRRVGHNNGRPSWLECHSFLNSRGTLPIGSRTPG